MAESTPLKSKSGRPCSLIAGLLCFVVPALELCRIVLLWAGDLSSAFVWLFAIVGSIYDWLPWIIAGIMLLIGRRNAFAPVALGILLAGETYYNAVQFLRFGSNILPILPATLYTLLFFGSLFALALISVVPAFEKVRRHLSWAWLIPAVLTVAETAQSILQSTGDMGSPLLYVACSVAVGCMGALTVKWLLPKE